MSRIDHGLLFLLSLDGFEFRFVQGHTVKIEAREVGTTSQGPWSKVQPDDEA